jgi:N-acetylglutamate synthase-like GNAT family acetyltransferase
LNPAAASTTNAGCVHFGKDSNSMSEKIIGSDRSLRTAIPADLRYIEHLSRKYATEVGFIPRSAMAAYIDSSNVTICEENKSEAGYLLGRDYLRWNIGIRPIFQAAVQMDAQKRHHGLALLTRTEVAAREAGQIAIQACCREGLDANEFWRIAGFEKICEMWPNNSRKKHVFCWRKLLTEFVPDWFYQPPPVAGYRGKVTNIPKPLPVFDISR